MPAPAPSSSRLLVFGKKPHSELPPPCGVDCEPNEQLQRSAEEVTSIPFSQSAFWDLQGLTWMTSMRQESFS